ncbi:unnamed protein product, partial [Prorocentrum cordatum]
VPASKRRKKRPADILEERDGWELGYEPTMQAALDEPKKADSDDSKEYIIARKVDGKQRLVATWADDYEWEVVGTHADQLSDKKSTGQFRLFKGQLDGASVITCIVNHKTRGQWLQIQHGSGQLLQLRGYKPEYFEDAKKWAVQAALDFTIGRKDKAKLEVEKAEWLESHGIET